MTQPLLFAPIRECVACERTAKPHARRVDDSPAIMGISFTIYRPSRRVKGQHRAAPRVQICEQCFAQAIAEPAPFMNGKAKKFLAAMRQSFSKCYSELLREDREAA
jgi:hypothetical protein